VTAVQQIIPLNILKCYLSIRRSKTEKITAFFYEILSPAGVCTSGIGYAGTGEDDETAVSVERKHCRAAGRKRGKNFRRPSLHLLREFSGKCSLPKR
jgi:hypothetical protein